MKTTVRIITKNSTVDIINALRTAYLTEESFNYINKNDIPNMRMLLVTEDQCDIAAFCIVGVMLGLPTEILVGGTFFSPVTIPIHTVTITKTVIAKGTHITVMGSDYCIEFDHISI